MLAPKPKNLGMREAAALPLIFITAWEGLVEIMPSGDEPVVRITDAGREHLGLNGELQPRHREVGDG